MVITIMPSARMVERVQHHNGWQAHWAEIIQEPLPGAAN